MANYWNDPMPNRPMALPYGNPFMRWGPVGFTAPRGGANWPPAADYQSPAPPAAQAMPEGPAPAVTPNTRLAPAGLPAQQTDSLAPADPTTYRDFNAATPAAPRPHPDHGADRAQGVAGHQINVVAAAPARGAPSNQPSRASASAEDVVARLAAAGAAIHQANVAVGGAQALPLPVGLSQEPIGREDAASDVDDETVVGNVVVTIIVVVVVATILNDGEEFSSEDDSDEDGPPLLRSVFTWPVA